MRDTNRTPETITSALAELCAQLGISEADFGGKVRIEGKDPVVASRHHIGESTAVLLALFGMELAAIWRRRTGRSQDVTVDVRNAVCNLAAMLYAKQNGVTVPFDDAGLVETTDYFRCKDGRWVFIVCSLPRLRQIACAVLDCQATRKAFAERCLQWNALELEEAMSAAGGCVSWVPTPENFDPYPHLLSDYRTSVLLVHLRYRPQIQILLIDAEAFRQFEPARLDRLLGELAHLEPRMTRRCHRPVFHNLDA